MHATLTTRSWEHWRDVGANEWDWPNFSPAELACRGTGRLMIDTDALDRLEQLRRALGHKPLIIRSAYRSPEWNAKVKGEKNSRHLLARAFDVSMDNHDPNAFVRAAEGVGFGGIGTYPRQGFVHIDTGPPRRWGDPFPSAAPMFTPEPVPPPVLATDTAKGTLTASAAGIAAVATQWMPVAEGIGRLPMWLGIAIVAAAAAGVLVWRWRRA